MRQAEEESEQYCSQSARYVIPIYPHRYRLPLSGSASADISLGAAMSQFFRPLYIILAASVLVASTTSASAANRRTWVSGAGTDTGGCTITAPCQRFHYAQSQTSDGGTINVI